MVLPRDGSTTPYRLRKVGDWVSGPKVDYVEVRKPKIDYLAEARERRLEASNKIQNMIHQIDSYLGVDVEVMSQDPYTGPSCEKIQQFQEQCKKELQVLLNTLKQGTELLNVEGILHEGEVLRSRFRENIKEEKQFIDKLISTQKQYQQMQKEQAELAQLKRKKIMRITGNTEKDRIVSAEDTREQVQAFTEEIHEFMKNPMTKKHKNSMLLLNQDLQELAASNLENERKSIRIQRLYEEYERIIAYIQRDVEDMKALYEEYKRECFDTDAPPLSLNEFNTKMELIEALNMAKKDAESKLSKDYIKRQIDDVMEKHGYNVVKSDLLQELNENGQVLYGVKDDTALSVFVSNSNQVTMRVVGIGFDTDISDAENNRLFQEQCAFCSMHPQITAELEMRGVILHPKNHMPPDRKYNKKIATKTKSSTQTMSRAKKELKRQTLKTLHKLPVYFK